MRIRQLLLVMLCTALCSSAAYGQKHYTEIDAPPLPDVQVPEPTRVELPNGMIVFLIEDHELPLVNISGRVGVGSVYEPADKVGLASITGEVMRTGGTETMSGDEINEQLESIGAVVETGIGETSGFAYMSTLKEHTDEVLDIFADILMNPAFGEDKIELSRTQEKSAVSRRNDDPQQIAYREFEQIIYGEDSPYARTTEYATVDNISREDLIAFHEQYFHPNNVILGVWGDFDTQEMVAKLREAFSDWPEKEDFTRPDPPPATADADFGVYLAPKQDVTQSTVLLGHPGEVRLDHPDYAALRIMNEVLSGGFAGRLFQNVRDDKGLAYAVFGAYTANYDRPGLFYAGVMTKSESTVEAAEAVKEEVEKMQQAPPTAEEMQQAKESFLNSFVFNFDTKQEIVNRIATYEYYGYPTDFLQKEKEAVENVAADDVLRVSKAYLKPDQVKIMVVGKPEDFGEPLTELGPVQEIDITIPTSEEETPEATEETLSQGQEILNAAIAAAGGREAFRNIRTLKQTGRTTFVTPDNQRIAASYEAVSAGSDRARMVQQTPMGEVVITINGDQVRMKSPQGEMTAPPSLKQQIFDQRWRDIGYLFTNAGRDGLQVQYVGQGDARGTAADVLLITPPGGAAPFRLYIEPSTKQPLMISYQGSDMAGAPVQTEEVFDDFRSVGGVTLPHGSTAYQNGKEAQETVVQEFQVNVPVDDRLFNTGS